MSQPLRLRPYVWRDPSRWNWVFPLLVVALGAALLAWGIPAYVEALAGRLGR